ncbi:Phosphate transporter family protein [Theileria parva strain Muguga]|uniref:Phosphate transporter n=1 Tax=Theileria parva TaxID=5875 RepID=Q4N4Z0_THEPA|nr:Phosphate transporter family protein [Theileria parva strain Muguga]EAN32783.1 Phosphate transporter family protein [Theileria parva strain Muguga]|eukprot:XP_765066.1 phosphate transporter [Theileria parva strain Muguga]
MASSHPELLWVLIATGISCSLLAVSIGSNDVANAFSTSIGSGTLNLRSAICIAFVFEILGSIFLGGTVSDAIRTKILNFSAFSDAPRDLALGMLSSSLGSFIFLAVASLFGIPVSTTHSLLGALAGFGVASGRFSGVRWIELLYIVISWFIVPMLSVFVSATFYIIIQELILKRRDSFKVMMNFHWIFNIIFSVPLSIFIAYENSVLRSNMGSSADSYRVWFARSNWNKFLSVLIVLSILSTASTIVSYTVLHFRIKGNWSYIESLHNIDPTITRSNKKKSRKFRLKKHRFNQKSEDKEHSDPGQEDNKESCSPDVENPDESCQDPENKDDKNSTSRNLPSTAFSKNYKEGEPPEDAKNAKNRGRLKPDGGSSADSSPDDYSLDNAMTQTDSSINRFLTGIKSAFVTSINKSRSFTNSNMHLDYREQTSNNSIKSNSSGHNGSGNSVTKSLSNSSKLSNNRKAIGKYKKVVVPTEIKKSKKHMTQTVFSAIQIVGASIAIISQSSNDTANAVSTFATMYFLYYDGIDEEVKTTPWYILMIGGILMGFGLAFFGYRVIKTVGLNITRVTPSRGYTIDCSSGTIVLILSQLGVPISSTHVAVSSILGVGMVQHLPAYNKQYSLIYIDEKNQELDPSNDPPANDMEETTGEQNLDSANAESHVSTPQGSNQHCESPVSADNTSSVLSLYGAEKKSLLAFFHSIFSRITSRHVNFGLYRKIFVTWIVTIFSTGFLSAIIFLLLKLFYKFS